MNTAFFWWAAVFFAIYLVSCVRLWHIRNRQRQSLKYLPARAMMPYSGMISMLAATLGVAMLGKGFIGSDDTEFGWLKQM